MSYILDAVSRARTHKPSPAPTASRAVASKWVLWRMGSIVILVALAVALFVAWLDAQRTRRVTAAPAASAALQAQADVVREDVPSMAPRPSRRASAPAAAASTTTTAMSGTGVRSAGALPELRSVARFSPPTTLSQPLPTPSPLGPGSAYAAAKSPPSWVAPAPAAAPEQARPLAIADLKSLSALPPDVRAGFSRMKLRVLFYAPQRRSRFALIDNREVREGDELFAGLRLEEITDNGMVLKHKDMLVLSPATIAP